MKTATILDERPSVLDVPAVTDPKLREIPKPTRTGRRRRDVVFALVLLALAGGWSFTLRPQSLGGPAGFVIVRGTSMLGTYDPGTLVIVHREASYSKGQIVAYHVPKGQVGEGIVVIHRIVGGSARTGFVTQGDNNPSPDDWRPRPADVMGRAWIVLPKLGQMLGFLHAPVPMAALGASIAVALLIVPGEKRKKGTGKR
jgi:signal peptidase